MKSTGIVRKVDNLGRVVLPKELRTTLNIEIGSPLEIFSEESGSIVLRKYRQACVICGGTEDTFTFKGNIICMNCKEEIIK